MTREELKEELKEELIRTIELIGFNFICVRATICLMSGELLVFLYYYFLIAPFADIFIHNLYIKKSCVYVN